MSDFTREQAIQWCRENKLDFTEPLFPPPSGWMWSASSGSDLVLQPIHTITDQGDEITRDEVLP